MKTQPEYSVATLLKKITLHFTNSSDIYSIRNIPICTPIQPFPQVS
jgi:hypothetical protein